eukprot:1192493-Prorocentrum_minimum.AAC.3
MKVGLPKDSRGFRVSLPVMADIEIDLQTENEREEARLLDEVGLLSSTGMVVTMINQRVTSV